MVALVGLTDGEKNWWYSFWHNSRTWQSDKGPRTTPGQPRTTMLRRLGKDYLTKRHTIFIYVDSTFHQLYRLKFSFKLVNISKSYARKLKGLFSIMAYFSRRGSVIARISFRFQCKMVHPEAICGLDVSILAGTCAATWWIHLKSADFAIFLLLFTAGEAGGRAEWGLRLDNRKQQQYWRQ